MTPTRERHYRVALKRLAQCRQAMELLMDTQDDWQAVTMLKVDFRHLREGIEQFAHDTCFIDTERIAAMKRKKARK